MHRIRHIGLQFARRCVQTATVLLIIALAFISLYAHYRAAFSLDELADQPGLKGEVLVRIDRGVSSMEAPQHFLDGAKGTLWSMRLFGMDFTDPLAAVEMAFASKKVYVPLFVSCFFWFLVTLLLGRVYCSWVCPGYLLFELTGKLRRLLRMAELPPAEVRFSLKNKYVVLLVGLAMAWGFGMPLFALVYPPAVLSRMAHAWVFGASLTGMLVLIGLLVAFELLVSPRWWCRTMCPGGALYALIGWPRLLRVKLVESRCTYCSICRDVCEPGLDPVTESRGLECDNCGRCARMCPERALTYGLGLPGRQEKPLLKASLRTSMCLAVAAVIIGTASTTVQAHHILGLPHYSYKENYPQAPTLEYPAQTGPYDVLLTSYPGKPSPGEAANIAIYIKNRQTGTPYGPAIGARVLQTFTFGNNREVMPSLRCVPFDHLHKFSVTFPEDGEYIVEITMEVEGKEEVIPFVMVAGAPSSTVSVLVATGVGMAWFLLTIRAIRIKRTRRQGRGSPDRPPGARGPEPLESR